MNIVRTGKAQWVDFKNLPVGATFEALAKVYMKIRTVRTTAVDGSILGTYNAVDLSNGELNYFSEAFGARTVVGTFQYEGSSEL